MTAALAPETVTPAAVLALLSGIERHGDTAPAAIAFRQALRRKGVEADQAGGLASLDGLIDAVADDDPTRANARLVILNAVWGELLPDLTERKSR
ncbi:hypothetical protein [Methylobacterium sp. SI9]|uniref:hypothetical protein n=1 Tax=Methylobacterium guangdongense TaxID=3138811 RepID=UPI00313EEF1A